MSYQSNNQSSLDKLMQMATLEQLNNMIHQMNKNINTNTNFNTNENKDILSLPIVQKVVMAYEDELKHKQSNNCCTCDCQKQVNDYIPLFDTILSKMNEQYHYHNSNLLRIEHKLDELFSFLDRSEKQHQQQRQEHIQEIDRSQLKLTDFPSFFRKYAIIDLTVASEATASEATASEAHIKEENITLKIEEKDMSDTEDSDDVTDGDEEEYSDASVEDPHVTRLTIEDEAVEEDVEEDVEEEDVEEDVEEEDLEEDDVEEEDLEEEAVNDEDLDEDLDVEEDVEEESEEEVRTEDEEEEKDEVKEQEEVDQEMDEEVFEIEIDDVTYFATDEENGILYEVDNGEVGRKVGIIKDGEPIFS